MTVTQPAYLVSAHPWAFRCGERAEIIGVVFCSPLGREPRACYRVRFADGVEDFVAVSDMKHYEIMSAGQEVTA